MNKREELNQLRKSTGMNRREFAEYFGIHSVWLTRNQLAELFDRDIKTIGKHELHSKY